MNRETFKRRYREARQAGYRQERATEQATGQKIPRGRAGWLTVIRCERRLTPPERWMYPRWIAVLQSLPKPNLP